MGKSILVTGGTGTLGSGVARALRAREHDVRVLSRREGPGRVVGDLRNRVVVDPVDAIVHCATTNGTGDVAAMRNLLAGARRAGSPHLVFISIVDIDRLPMFYYRAKLEAEQLLIDSGLPWTILRTTQFHDLIAGLTRIQARSPVLAALSGVRFQPVDAGEVAQRLAELAVAEPAGRVPDVGGPQIRSHASLTRAYLRATGRRRLVVPVRPPGGFFRALREGSNLVPDGATGRRTFEEFLAN
ncbi:SDR family oxidoreductase [Saccharopolyspora griseoalba]|uniref:SDR family oxidoreductase n=1 Tax=Saccharopolyspora griseoalba TaxID=1431848 RepID=A0ABW2LRB3_9PSEU